MPINDPDAGAVADDDRGQPRQVARRRKATRSRPATSLPRSRPTRRRWKSKPSTRAVAVATPTGLITPIVKAAETKSLPDISSEMKDLAQRAKENKLKPTEFQGGTFSLSNLGMFGIKQFDAIINPPQGCILAVGAGEQTPVVIDGKVAIATIMNCNLSVDHRVVDGAVGAEYLAALKALLEDPKQLAA
jgi:pyruvate/2-oxoglutarate dehydrogenase complex dihydrolipoamide acyltransferase (E2) component